MNKSFKKTISLIFAFLLSFILTGCVKQSYFVQVKDDSTVNFAIEMLVNKDKLDKFDKLNIQKEQIIESKAPLFQSMTGYYESLGFNITEEHRKDGSLKIQMYKLYPSVGEFNDEIAKLYKSNKSGLLLNIKHSDNLSGVNDRYEGKIRYLMDDDIISEMKDNVYLYEFLKDDELLANVTIYDNGELIGLDSINSGAAGEYTALINGKWDLLENAPINEFKMETTKRNQTFYIVLFFTSIVVIAILLITLFNKGLLSKWSKSLKNKIEDRKLAREDN